MFGQNGMLYGLAITLLTLVVAISMLIGLNSSTPAGRSVGAAPQERPQVSVVAQGPPAALQIQATLPVMAGTPPQEVAPATAPPSHYFVPTTGRARADGHVHLNLVVRGSKRYFPEGQHLETGVPGAGVEDNELGGARLVLPSDVLRDGRVWLPDAAVEAAVRDLGVSVEELDVVTDPNWKKPIKLRRG